MPVTVAYDINIDNTGDYKYMYLIPVGDVYYCTACVNVPYDKNEDYKNAYEKALKMSEVLFSGNLDGLSKEEIEICFKGVPSFEVEEGIILIDMLVNNNVASSRREVREFLASGAITINGNKMTDENLVITKDTSLYGELLVIRKGKKKYYLAKIKAQ